MVIDTWALDALILAVAYLSVCVGTSFVLSEIWSRPISLMPALAELIKNVKVDVKQEATTP